MKTSALKMVAAIAVMSTGGVSFAQQYPDTTNAPVYSGTPDAAMRADSTDRPGTYYSGSMNRNCAGLSDRQTERSCREGFAVEHNDPWASALDRGGRTEDQAQ